jgi:hypothetical protein
MSADGKDVPIVVTLREIEKVLANTEAVSNIDEAARQDQTISDLERGAAMAAVGQALRELRQSEDGSGAPVMTTAQHGPASRLQSLIASGEAGSLQLEVLDTGGYEAKFDTGDWLGWARVAWEKLKHPTPHDMLRPKHSRPAPLPEQARIGIVGDWGTNLYGAPRIAASIRNDPDPYTMLMHLGDVYYSGTKKEVQQRFLDAWPSRPGAINRAINSNHEMYSGGYAYFDMTLPRFEQESSYFAFQNQHWTLVGLDVAYTDHAIDDAQVEWLKGILAQAGDRKVVLFSHHQLYSHWEHQGTKLVRHPGFGQILRRKRIFAWYWGHEHRCSIFEGPDKNFGILGRCIGHGGMPQSRKKTRELPRAHEAIYQSADWRRSPAVSLENNLLPSVTVLEGPNPFISGEEDKFSPHGYAVLVLDGPRLREQVLDPDRHIIYDKLLVA